MNEDFFDFLQDTFPSSWFDEVHTQFHGLTNAEIAQSVHEASIFFNIDDPAAIQESFATGVFTNACVTPNDDIVAYNTQQMLDMGITDKEGLDLIMTHEGAHRMLQGSVSSLDLTPHQVELCCDYMAGVRAGLNGMDFTKMQNALCNLPECETHPSGQLRADAIEDGASFAYEYMQKHGKAPTFSDCLEHFNETNMVAPTDDLHHNNFVGLTQSEIDRKMSHAESEKRRYEGLVEHHKYMAKNGLGKADTEYHLKQASIFQTRANECAAEANKWRYTKPDKK